MAKYEDYRQKQDELEGEIEDAVVQTEVRQENSDTLPEQFQGKTAEEIAQSYVALETLQRSQTDELGTLRRTVDTLIETQLNDSSQTDAEPVAPVTVDDLYDDAEGAIARVVSKSQDSRVEELEQRLQRTEAENALATFTSQNAGWQETVNTPEFREWVQSSSYRGRLAAQADKYDFDAASDLLEMYGDHTGVRSNAVAEAARESALQDAGLETGTTAVDTPVETFSRAEYMDHKQRAARGFNDSEIWLKQNRAAVMDAYADGRMTD